MENIDTLTDTRKPARPFSEPEDQFSRIMARFTEETGKDVAEYWEDFENWIKPEHFERAVEWWDDGFFLYSPY